MSEPIPNPENHLSAHTPLTRRDFLKMAGAAVATGALAAIGGRTPAHADLPALADLSILVGLPVKPNLLLLVSDQERYPQHWPDGWAEANLPNHQRLAQNGLTFQRAFCNSSMCSPSRATMFTGLYPAQHGLERTGTPNYQLPLSVQNMARMLASAGYNVVLKGKWHMSYSADGSYPPTDAEVAAYGFTEWEPTNAGDGTEVTGFGGGCAQNDAEIADQAVAFINSPAATAGPFALIVTFVNPHDVLAYPLTWDDDTCGGNEYGTTADFTQGIELADTVTYDEDLSANNKPTAQNDSKALLASGLGILSSPPSLEPRNYLNFYAQLHKLVDEQLGRVLDALEAQNLQNDTLVLYTSDHGEMGLAHGGLRQKMFNAYEETIHVPLIISNPILFPAPVTTSALASLVDFMPTLASVGNVPNPGQYWFSGFDLSPLFTNPAGSVQDAILFTFDDQDAGQPTPPPASLAVDQPNHVRCIREANWKYARYYDPSAVEPDQFELYDLVNDPDEYTNLAGDPAYAKEEARLAAKLAEIEAARLAPLPQTYLPLIMR